MLVGDGDVVGGWVEVHGLSLQAIQAILYTKLVLLAEKRKKRKETGDCKTTGTVLTRSSSYDDRRGLI